MKTNEEFFEQLTEVARAMGCEVDFAKMARLTPPSTFPEKLDLKYSDGTEETIDLAPCVKNKHS